MDDVDIHTTAGKLADLQRRMDEAVHAGSAAAVERQHARGKQTARERIELLLDKDSFTELDEFARHRSTSFGMEQKRPYGDGVVTGFGTVDDRPVCVFSQDVTVFGGSLGQVYGEKIVKIIDFALKTGCPLIGINEGGGARIQEGVVSLGLYGEIFRRNTHASGVIPQISLIMGAAAGGHVYSPALTDFVVMVDQTSQMFITGPDVIKTVTGEDVTMEELGGGRTHNTKSGNSHYLAADEQDAIDYVQALLSYLPAEQPRGPTGLRHRRRPRPRRRRPALWTPSSRTRRTSRTTCTRSSRPCWTTASSWRCTACSRPTSWSASAGSTAAASAIVANQPLHFAGCLDIDASEKAARFVRTCDAFNIPVITFVDVPGFLPGTDQEWNGIIRRGREADLRLRRGHRPAGHGDHPQGVRRGVRRDGVQAPRCRRQPGLADRADRGDGRPGSGEHPVPQGARRDTRTPTARRAELITAYDDELANPYVAAERGYVDAVIMPARDPGGDHPGAAAAAHQAGDPAAQEAREHPAVTALRGRRRAPDDPGGGRTPHARGARGAGDRPVGWSPEPRLRSGPSAGPLRCAAGRIAGVRIADKSAARTRRLALSGRRGAG